jgi:menaquinone-9 beta-reductase
VESPLSTDLNAPGLGDLDGTSWDAIVIGAGPAGATAALRLSLAGVRVLLVEKKQFPRLKVCGACLSRAALTELQLAGLGSLVERLGGIGLSEFQLRFRGRLLRMDLAGGAVVSRERFDAALVAAAEGAGCRFFDGALALVDAESDSGGLRNVRLMHQGRCTHVAARTILNATGLGHCVVPNASAPRTTVTDNSRIGAGCRIAEPPAAYIGRGVFMAVGAGGYVGMVRVEDGSLNVAAAFDPALVRLARTPGAAACAILEEAGAPPVAGLEKADWQGTPGLTRQARPLSSDRVFFLGDAASYVEPFTGEGIAWALASARAVEPFALRAIERWDPRLARDWGRAHHRLTGRRQLVCRAIAIGLRRPLLIRFGLEILERAPFVARGVMRLIDKPLVYSTAS